MRMKKIGDREIYIAKLLFFVFFSLSFQRDLPSASAAVATTDAL